jgi:hypothetical protein
MKPKFQQSPKSGHKEVFPECKYRPPKRIKEKTKIDSCRPLIIMGPVTILYRTKITFCRNNYYEE